MKHQKSTTGLISFRDKFNVSETEEKYWYGKIRDKLRKDGLLEKRVKDEIEYNELVLYKRSEEYIKSICEGLGYTDEEVKHILSNAEGKRVYGRMKRKSNTKDKRDRIIELNGKKLNNTIHPNEMIELKELTKAEEKEEKEDETESRLKGTLVNGGIILIIIFLFL
jgi:hypothetical protein